ncbi:siderophore-iron reductase FhuF [Pseudomonas cavernicola]|uniref:Siderophore-iron reductase FhuF n=2 Tax=Pseudomonas cavernicola TaxID=2320866 RepID=A0A418XPR1_9PSED|nr:siderophore-iron reductase FhuF [Pseudomonas cavernicola]
MQSILERLFPGELACFAETLALPDDPRPAVSVAALLEPAGLDERLSRLYGLELMQSQRSVLVSQYSKYYFMALIPPVLAASLLHDWRLPLAPDALRVVLSDNGLPQAVQLPDEGERWPDVPDDPFLRFAELVEGNLQPFIHTLAADGQVAPQVLWGNAGDYFETTLRRLAELTAASLTPGYAVLEARRCPDGTDNPLFAPIRYVPQAGVLQPRRERRVCCLRHRVAGIEHCEHCPLLRRMTPSPGANPGNGRVD